MGRKEERGIDGREGEREKLVVRPSTMFMNLDDSLRECIIVIVQCMTANIKPTWFFL